MILGDLPFGGSEYPGIVFSTPDNATIAHEVAHQWFYGMVGNDQYNDPFLDESLTAFAEQRFHKSYRCDLAGRSTGDMDSAPGWTTGRSIAKAYEDTIYRGGACALTVLRRDIGAKAFDRDSVPTSSANHDKLPAWMTSSLPSVMPHRTTTWRAGSGWSDLRESGGLEFQAGHPGDLLEL